MTTRYPKMATMFFKVESEAEEERKVALIQAALEGAGCDAARAMLAALDTVRVWLIAPATDGPTLDSMDATVKAAIAQAEAAGIGGPT